MSSLLPKINIQVVDEYSDAALSQYELDENIKKIHYGASRDFDLYLSEIEKFIGHSLHPVVVDLYKIAVTVYISDLQITRPTRAQSRTICILISVSDKSKWDAEKQHLESTLRILSGDNFTFHFVQGKYPDTGFVFTKKDEHKAVSLFSGGLDSLAGVKWLVDKAIKPVLVSHDSNSKKTTHVQNILYSGLKKIINNLDSIQVKSRPISSDLKSKELTQKTRSFLYLTLGSMIALELGISDVYLFENGVLALNIPITTSRIHTNTKTAHPTYISNYNRILSDVFPDAISVKNPFVSMTKGEVISVLNNDSYKPLVKETLTCSRAFKLQITQGTNAKHCGVCIPCILRRSAMHSAALWDYDDVYASDIVGEFEDIPQEGKTILFQLLYFIRSLDKDNTDILTNMPEFYIEEVDTNESITMMRRYGIEVKTMINEKGSSSLKENLIGLL